MKYENVCIEGMGFVIPEKIVTTDWFEEQLAPVYGHLGIPKGFFERLTGIRERRWWADGQEPSDGAAQAGLKAIENAGIDKDEVQCLIHASVSRDYIEPATAVIVHHKMGLHPRALNFDVVNACLGFINGMLLVGNMIELGQIETGVVVAAEAPREGQLATIKRMLSNGVTKDDVRDNLASFTLGSASVAMVLTHKSKSKTGKQLLGGAAYSGTHNHELCVAQRDWMRTDSTTLLEEGGKVVIKAWELFQQELGWPKETINRFFTHQISEPQRRYGMSVLGLPTEGVDYPNLYTLGNTGSVAAPLCMAQGIADGILNDGDRVCLMGVGSGVNSIILGIQW